MVKGGIPLWQWQDVKIVVQNGRAETWLNGQQVYALEYQNSLGELTGLRIKLRGRGEVDAVEVSDPGSL